MRSTDIQQDRNRWHFDAAKQKASTLLHKTSNWLINSDPFSHFTCKSSRHAQLTEVIVASNQRRQVVCADITAQRPQFATF